MELEIMVEIFMDFNENDEPVVSVKGAKGRSCSELTKGLEMALGKVVVDEKTPEYYEREVAQANERASNKR
jgi:hypothetical protein